MRLTCLLLVLAAGACSTPPHNEPMMSDTSGTPAGQTADEPPAKQLTLDEPFTLRRGEKALLPADDVEVRFDSVTGDSRCPANATCVRAGEAYAHFTLLEADGTVTPFTLEIEGLLMEMQDMERYPFQQVDRFSVALLLLQPYPGLPEEEDMPETATLEMRRTMR